MAATPPSAARAHRQIEAQVGVGEEEDPNVVGHPYYGMLAGVCSAVPRKA